MEKKKETFTRRECIIDMKARFKSDYIRFLYLYFGVVEFPLIIFSLLLYLITDSALILVLLVTIPLIPVIYKLGVLLYYTHLADKGCFCVSEDQLCNIGEDEFEPIIWRCVAWWVRRRYGFGSHNSLYFARHGKFIVKHMDNYMWSEMFYGMSSKGLAIETSTCGDTFYVVTLNNNPKKPLVVYNKKLFKYDER